jgi:hypothetical protein
MEVSSGEGPDEPLGSVDVVELVVVAVGPLLSLPLSPPLSPLSLEGFDGVPVGPAVSPVVSPVGPVVFPVPLAGVTGGATTGLVPVVTG